TYRLCRRVLMFHHFPEETSDFRKLHDEDLTEVDLPEVGQNCLVRSTDFQYTEGPVASFIISVTRSGYRREAGADTFVRRSGPPLEFEYSQVELHDAVYTFDDESLQNLPVGLDDRDYQWVDLDGEGLSGILAEQAGGWFYKRNLS